MTHLCLRRYENQQFHALWLRSIIVNCIAASTAQNSGEKHHVKYLQCL